MKKMSYQQNARARARAHTHTLLPPFSLPRFRTRPTDAHDMQLWTRQKNCINSQTPTEKGNLSHHIWESQVITLLDS